MRGMIGGRRGWLAAAVAAICVAGAAWAQHLAPPTDPNDPEAEARAEAMMEEMFDDLPMDIDPSGMTSGRGMFGALFGPSVTKADFQSYVKILGLGKDESAAAETVYAQRLANYEAKGKPLQELISEALKGLGDSIRRGQPGEQPANLAELEKAAKEIQAERDAMAKGVMEDLKALASTEQLERWDKVERAARRNVLMRSQGLLMVPGALVDVPGALEAALAKKGVEPPSETDRERIARALEAHETALDEQARAMQPVDELMRSAGFGGDTDPEKQKVMMKAMGDGWLIAEKVRLAHEAAVKTIGTTLTDATRAAFMDEYHSRAYPMIYRTFHGEKVMDAAAGLPDLSDEQRQTITAMRDEHAAKMREMRPKAAAQMVEQQKVQAQMMSAKDDEARMKAMEKMSEAYREDQRRAMKEADKEVVKKVRAMLSEAQRAKLPKRPKPNLPFEMGPAGEGR
jgi:hypothetical protein